MRENDYLFNTALNLCHRVLLRGNDKEAAKYYCFRLFYYLVYNMYQQL